MKKTREFTTDDASWVREHSCEVRDHYSRLFASSGTVFQRAQPLLERFVDASDAVLARGWSQWSALDEVHNELGIAGAILDARDYRIDELVYEPPPAVGGKTIDFRAKGHDGQSWLVDVKTIAPERIDRWEQFDTAKAKAWLTDRVDLVLLRDWMGGELWHSKTAARSRMLEYTLELEGKLEGYPGFHPATTVLMLCGNGFHWHEDELEDFVAFYADGEHRADDSLAAMEKHFIDVKSLQLPRRVRTFGYCQRPSCGVSPSRLNWCVRPPTWPMSMTR
jgi:hypothetical protein